MEGLIVPAVAIVTPIIGLPWLIFHYITKWKSQSSITAEDEKLLDGLHDLARRLDDRMATIERIIQADNPNWRALGADPVEAALEDRTGRVAELGRANRPVRRN